MRRSFVKVADWDTGAAYALDLDDGTVLYRIVEHQERGKPGTVTFKVVPSPLRTLQIVTEYLDRKSENVKGKADSQEET